MAEKKFHIQWRGHRRGPFGWTELLRMAQRGEISPLHEISPDGREWLPAKDMDGLLSPAKTAPTPAAAPPPLPKDRTEDSEEDEDGAPLTLLDEEEASAARSATAPERGKGWCYSHAGTTGGPVSGKMLKAMARDGRLLPDDAVWREGENVSRAAFEIPGLKGIFAKSGEPAAPAPHGRRIGAFAVDLAILAPFAGSLLYLALTRSGGALLAIPACLLPLVYKVLLEGLLGGTVGKMALRLRLQRGRDDNPGGFGRAVLRNLFLLLLCAATLFFALGPNRGVSLWITEGLILLYAVSAFIAVTNEQHRALHDLIGGTRCVGDPPE